MGQLLITPNTYVTENERSNKPETTRTLANKLEKHELFDPVDDRAVTVTLIQTPRGGFNANRRENSRQDDPYWANIRQRIEKMCVLVYTPLRH